MLENSRFYGELILILICVLMQCQQITSNHHEEIVKRMDIATCLGNN